jgi:hypothetical protein
MVSSHVGVMCIYPNQHTRCQNEGREIGVNTLVPPKPILYAHFGKGSDPLTLYSIPLLVAAQPHYRNLVLEPYLVSFLKLHYPSFGHSVHSLYWLGV